MMQRWRQWLNGPPIFVLTGLVLIGTGLVHRSTADPFSLGWGSIMFAHGIEEFLRPRLPRVALGLGIALMGTYLVGGPLALYLLLTRS